MRLFENKMIVGCICIAIAALLAFVALPGIYKAKEKTVIIYKMANDVSAGTKIEKKMLREVEVGSYGLPETVIKNAVDIVGKYTKTSISKYDILLSSKFADFSTDEKLTRIISDGKCIISVSVSSIEAGVANHLQKGDYITLACFLTSANNVEIYDELKNIEAYGIENSKTVNVQEVKVIDNSASNDNIPATLTLIVTEAQAKRLVYAEYSGKLHAIFEKRGAM